MLTATQKAIAEDGKRFCIILQNLPNQMDVKGRCSGKHKIWNSDGSPCDILGWAFHAIGYQPMMIGTSLCHHSAKNPKTDHYVIDYTGVARFMDLHFKKLDVIIREIDRKGSTNKSIEKTIKEIFRQRQKL